MEKTIRVLGLEDLPYMEAMQTGIEDDYVTRIFERLVTTDQDRLFGLFLDDQLASVCGYSIFAKHYAILGRIRSDIRYRGKDLATALTSQVMDEAFKLPDIQWVGANTQEENLPARRVLEKLGLSPQVVIYGAIAKDVSPLENGSLAWNKLSDLKRKKQWVYDLYVKNGSVFPYECYYLLPASPELFAEDELETWSFFESEDATRVVIVKRDIKTAHYLHAIYPWEDLMDQPGLWETIASAYKELCREVGEDALIWMDFTKEQALSLPENHQFDLPSPWMLYGTGRTKAEKGA
ncbi:GNAT family N-acetyltransferase [Planococcus liqunii]|uniref:GNAT family N-acetyltransferase n=1 Tax=Planococcus liqunii TaxID=3058394 RepID=UPI002616247A|nr:GNAT family N-acetyltransferase [Planococcus sp. N056]WKA51892.1 GNAT family N-acetyltransferase [Planococcus sp. N056]